MTWTLFDTWIVTAGFLAAAACALPGCFLVLRRASMMGDAISHAVLPGLAIAFLVTGSLASWPMFIGAAAVGVLTAVLTQWVQRSGKVEASAALGIVFTTLFALGILLITRYADGVHLDADCVLYGAVESSPLVAIAVGPWWIPQAVLVNGTMLLINAAFITLFYKELKISSFDPQLATSLGINAQAMHYLLMALVAATVVAAFESVGSILVVAMLIVPGAAAYLLTDRLWVMLVVSVVFAACSAVLGHAGAVVLPALIGFSDVTTAGMMAVTAGGLFVAAMLMGPRYGLVSRAVGRLRLAVRIAQEDLLATLYRHEEPTREARGLERTGQPMVQRLAVARLQRRGWITADNGHVALTEPGRLQARDLIRSHRLWETYLERFTPVSPEHLHQSADRLEHATDARLQRDLAQDIGSPALDPQGRAIPPEREGADDKVTR